MKLKILSRSGRELVSGGLEVKDGVSARATPKPKLTTQSPPFHRRVP